jgi:hypothetical protein
MSAMRVLLVMSLPVLTWNCAAECGERAEAPVTVRSRHRVAISSGFPRTYSLHGLLQQCEPSAVVEPLDYGGIRSTEAPVVSLAVSTWTGTFFRFNGLDANDPYQSGRPMLLPAPEDLAAVTVAPYAAAAGARAYSGEVHMQTRDFAAGVHLELSSFNTGRPLHARSRQPAERFRYFTRNRFALTTPLGRNLDVLLTGTGQWSAADEASRLLFGNAWLRYRLGKAAQLSGGFTGTRLDLSRGGFPAGFEPLTARRLAPPLRPSHSLLQEDHLDALQASWTRGEVQVRYGYSQAHLGAEPTRDSPDIGLTPRVDLFSGQVEGPPLFWNNAARGRHEVAATYRQGGFSLASGGQTAEAINRPIIPSLAHVLTLHGVPRIITRFHPTQQTRGTLRVVYGFAQYERRWTSWLSVMAGAYADRSSSRAITWRSFAPRAGLALRPPGSDRLVLRATYARTVSPLSARLLDFADPASLSGEEFRPDGALLRRFGGRYSSIDAELGRPFRNEFTVSGEAGLPFGSFLRVRLFRSDDQRRLAALNTGVPGTAYRPVTVLDPGGDFLDGTFDDQTLTLYAQDPATFGMDHFLLTNPRGLRVQNSGLVAQAGTSQRRWSAWFSFTAEKSIGPTNSGNQVYDNDPGVVGNLFADPVTLLNATGRSFFDRAFIGKAAATYEFPRRLGALEAGTILNYLDGLVFGRRLLVDGLPQGPLAVFATVRGSPEGGHRTEFHASLDLRVSRVLTLAVGRLRLSADLFNLTNAAFKLREDDRSGPRFLERTPLLYQPGRMLRLGAGYEF